MPFVYVRLMDWPYGFVSLTSSSLMGSPLSCIRLLCGRLSHDSPPLWFTSLMCHSPLWPSLRGHFHSVNQSTRSQPGKHNENSIFFVYSSFSKIRWIPNMQRNIQWNMQLNMQIAEVYASLCKKGTSSLRSQSSCGISTAWASSPRRFELRIAKFEPGKVWKGFRREF